MNKHIDKNLENETEIVFRDIAEFPFEEEEFSIYYDETDDIWYAEHYDPEVDEIIRFDEDDFESGSFSIFGREIVKSEFEELVDGGRL